MILPAGMVVCDFVVWTHYLQNSPLAFLIVFGLVVTLTFVLLISKCNQFSIVRNCTYKQWMWWNSQKRFVRYPANKRLVYNHARKHRRATPKQNVFTINCRGHKIRIFTNPYMYSVWSRKHTILFRSAYETWSAAFVAA